MPPAKVDGIFVYRTSAEYADFFNAVVKWSVPQRGSAWVNVESKILSSDGEVDPRATALWY